MATPRESTVEHEASMTGTSLHSGAKVRLTVKPALAGSGYQFRRMDLADQPTIPAFLEKVKQVERA
ncbi:MAG: UDP-3-O-acyl-N-acetylglucosamine deacetylase [Verrucomicrobiota bacterium]